MPESFTFIHAADLHLGAPFRGLDHAASGLANRTNARSSGVAGSGGLLSHASFTALARLEALCLAEKAAFLILAGDIYDEIVGLIHARLALRDMFVRLGDAGIRVFWAHGNHDPLESGPQVVRWPDTVTIFGPEPTAEPVLRDGALLAMVHGVSHNRARQEDNLALRFQTTGDAQATLPLHGHDAAACPHIGVLHCAVGGSSAGHAPYAPCTLNELLATNFAYWALGHVHQPRVLSQTPPVVYPGSLQGMHINESGPHGCMAVQVRGGRCEARPVPLAPVLWHTLSVAMDATDATLESLDALETLVPELAAQAARDLAEGMPYAVDAVLFRVRLEGRTELDASLRRPGALEALSARLREILEREAGGDGPQLLLKDLRLHTAPALDLATMVERDDLVGEVLRCGLHAASPEGGEALEQLAERALKELYGHRRLKKLLPMPDADELRALTLSACSLCCASLEQD